MTSKLNKEHNVRFLFPFVNVQGCNKSVNSCMCVAGVVYLEVASFK